MRRARKRIGVTLQLEVGPDAQGARRRATPCRLAGVLSLAALAVTLPMTLSSTPLSTGLRRYAAAPAAMQRSRQPGSHARDDDYRYAQIGMGDSQMALQLEPGHVRHLQIEHDAVDRQTHEGLEKRARGRNA